LVLSVVIPIYNCEECLPVLHDRLVAALTALGLRYEIVFVDDRGADNSWAVLRTIAADDTSVKVVRLSRNFGQHIAITAGIAHADGDWLVLMDCDLQDRPEDIAILLEKGQQGYDVVFSRRLNRSQSAFRRLAGRAYFRFRNFLTKTHMDSEHGSLMAFSRQVANEFLRVRDKDRQHGVILAWLGFESAMVDLPQAPRHAGKSSYTFGKLVQSAIDGLFFQTTILLRWIVYAGFVIALAGVALAVALIAFYFFVQPPPGWTSLAVLFLVIGGFIITSLGVTSLYVGKIFEQVKDRPLYIVDRLIVNGEERRPHSAEMIDDATTRLLRG
jgi:dolichol-phosphate mannosyltransferase